MTKFLNISTDNTLGGNAPSDALVVSQKAIKEYVDNQAGGGGYHPDLFTWQWADHELNDVQWLRADTFSWQSGAVYQAAYQHLVDDIPAEVIAITVLVLSTPIVYDRYTDGDVSGARHPYCWQIRSGTGKIYTDSETPSVGDFTYTTAQATQEDLSINSIVLPSPETETIAGTTISYYEAADGHKIVLADQESKVAAIYAATGVAWYYILDTANQRFKLPRSSHNKYTESLSVVGTGKVLGLTNGTDTFALNSGATYARLTIGYNAGQNVANSGGYDAGYNVNWRIGVSKDPTYSGLTTTSIEQETDQYKHLYFYVGNFTQTALENTAGITAETLNDKADKDLTNVSSSGKETAIRWGLPDFTTPTATGLALNTSYQATTDGYVQLTAASGGSIYGSTNANIQISNDNSTFVVAVADASYSSGGSSTLIAPVRKGQYYKGSGGSGSMVFYSLGDVR